MPSVRELQPEALRRRCPVDSLHVDTDAASPDMILGQARATRAIQFALAMPGEGYNVYTAGPVGGGKTSGVLAYLTRYAVGQPTPDDWVYVQSSDEKRPQALRLPPGEGEAFRQEVNRLLDDLAQGLERAFDHAYAAEVSRLDSELTSSRQSIINHLNATAQSFGYQAQRPPKPLALRQAAPDKGHKGKKVRGKDKTGAAPIATLPPELRAALEQAQHDLRECLRSYSEQRRQLDRDTVALAIGDLFTELKARYAEHREAEGISAWLDALSEDIFERGAYIARRDDLDKPLRPRLNRLAVHVLVSREPGSGLPVIFEPHPTLADLTGRIEQRGEASADHTSLRPGALHRANGGFLVLDVEGLRAEPQAWEALKRALKTGEIVVEDVRATSAQVATLGLTPQPIPLQVKVILLGEMDRYYELYEQDPDFRQLFKVRADFDIDMPWDDERVRYYAQLARRAVETRGAAPFAPDGLAALVEYGARLAEDQGRLTALFGHLTDLIREASLFARRRGAEEVCAADFQAALDERVYRARMYEESVRRALADRVLAVDTEGWAVGQINSLSVFDNGEYAFCRPTRVTARTFVGEAGVVNIEREVDFSGQSYEKGVLILAGYLGGKYAQDMPLSLSATIAREQAHEYVNGDSSSAAELLALLSSLADLPLRQVVAVTGAVDQMGYVRAIGGVNTKIEGFFDTCHERGLTGSQGVLIPAASARDLMLRPDVIAAVAAGQFHVWTFETVDEGIAFLTGVAAGELQADGEYPPETVNGRAQLKLRHYARQRNRYTTARLTRNGLLRDRLVAEMKKRP